MEIRRTDKERLHYVEIAAQEAFKNRALNSPSSALDPMTITVAGVDYDLEFREGEKVKEVEITIGTDDKIAGGTKMIDPRGAGPQLYGLVTKDLDMDKRLILGSPDRPTHAFFGKSPKKNAALGSFIHGAIDAVDTDVEYEASGPITTGLTWRDPAECDRFVWLPSETYLSNVTIGGRNVSGFATGRSYLIVCGSRTTVTGTFTGRITIFSRGSVLLKPPIIVTPGSTLVVMTDAAVEVEDDGEIDCHLYTSNRLNIPPNSGGTINWTGSIVAKSVMCKTTLNLTLDSFFYKDEGSYEDFYLPRN